MTPYKKVHPIRDEEGRRLWAVSQHPQRCQACLGKFDWRGWQVHHIAKFKRSDEKTNWILLCAICHDKIHLATAGQRITLCMVLTLKQMAAPDEFDLDRLIELHGKPIELEPIPEWLLAERKGRRRQ